MGDSGSEDTSDSYDANMGLSDAEVAAATGDDNNQSRSNIVNSSTYDAQFTADNLEARGLEPSNFMSASNFAQTTQGGAGGDDTTSTAEDFIDSTGISVPTIQAAGTSPTFAQSASIFDPDLGTMTGRRDTAPRGLETGVMAPEQRGTPVTVQSFLPAAVAVDRLAPQTKQERGLQAVANMFAQGRDQRAGMGDPRGIDFGVTAPVDPSRGMTPQLSSQIAARDGKLTVGDVTPGLREFTKGVDDEIAARSMPGTAVDFNPTTTDTGTRTTAIRAEDPFDPNVGKPFDVERLEQMERLQEPTLLERAGLPSALTAIDPERISKDRMATSIALGRPVGLVEGFNFTAPDMTKDKETIEQFNQRISARIPDNQLVKDGSGMVIGIKDASGRLVEGVDPNAQMQEGDSEEVKKAPPKAPTDPCPEGYQLIDGKCTLMEKPVDEGTGFIRFPTDRTPPFQTGPFTPKTVATDPKNITPLNPVTFRLSDIFKT